MIFKKSMDLMTNGFCYQVINLHLNHSLEQVFLILIFSKLDIIVRKKSRVLQKGKNKF